MLPTRIKPIEEKPLSPIEQARTDLSAMLHAHEQLLRHIALNYLPLMEYKDDFYLFGQLDKYCGTEWRSKYPNYK